MRTRIPGDFARINTVIHAAIIASVLIYLVVVMVLERAGWPGGVVDGQTLKILAIAFGLMAAMQLGLAWALPSLLLNDQRIRDCMLEASGDPLREALGRSRVTWIIRLAILEAIAIDGLVLAIIAQDASFFYLFGAVAFLALAAARFNAEPILKIYERLAAEKGWPMKY